MNAIQHDKALHSKLKYVEEALGDSDIAEHKARVAKRYYNDYRNAKGVEPRMERILKEEFRDMNAQKRGYVRLAKDGTANAAKAERRRKLHRAGSITSLAVPAAFAGYKISQAYKRRKRTQREEEEGL